jgi:sugar lactone lactonase YvrE
MRSRKLILLFVTAVLVLAGLMTGCATPAGEVFPAPAKPVVFPPAPERARVNYVGQLQASGDLKPAVSFMERVGGALFGKPPMRSMLSPYALCTDGGDRLYVADSNAQVVHLFDLNARKYQEIRPDNAEKRFSQPVGVTFDRNAGKLFVADSAASRVLVFDHDGKALGEVGVGIVRRPCGIAYDAKNNRLLVADTALHQVVILAPTGKLLARLGSRGTGLGQFNFPTNVTLDSCGRIYVSDSLNFRIQQFNGATFSPIRQIGRKGDMPGYFGQPKGIACDSDGHLYVVDAHFESVQIFSDTGELLLDFGNEGREPGEFWLPAGIFIDPRNRIWVADSYNRRVQVFDYLPQSAEEKPATKPAEVKP